MGTINGYAVPSSDAMADRGVKGVPIGTVLPYVGPLDQRIIGEDWRFCDGSKITTRDKSSPFENQNTPNLNTADGRFVMGVHEASAIAEYIPDGHYAPADRKWPVHALVTVANARHSSEDSKGFDTGGGAKRGHHHLVYPPASFGFLFIMRVR